MQGAARCAGARGEERDVFGGVFVGRPIEVGEVAAEDAADAVAVFVAVRVAVGDEDLLGLGNGERNTPMLADEAADGGHVG